MRYIERLPVRPSAVRCGWTDYNYQHIFNINTTLRYYAVFWSKYFSWLVSRLYLCSCVCVCLCTESVYLGPGWDHHHFPLTPHGDIFHTLRQGTNQFLHFTLHCFSFAFEDNTVFLRDFFHFYYYFVFVSF